MGTKVISLSLYNYKLINKTLLKWKFFLFSAFLGDIKNAYTKNPKLENLLFDPFFKKAVDDAQDSWRQVVAQAAILGIPTPALSTALAFYDGYRHEKLPANLLQVIIIIRLIFKKIKLQIINFDF